MENEIYYAIHEAIQVMEHYNTGEDFALVSSLRRMHELEQKLQQHNISGKRPDCPYCMEPISERMIQEWDTWLKKTKAAI